MVIVLALLAGPAHAQVNVAPLVEYGKKPGTGFDAQGRFGFALGNVQFLDLGLDAAFHVSRPFAADVPPKDREGDDEETPISWFRDRFVVFGNYGRRTIGSSDERTVVVDSRLTHVRYTRMIVRRFGVEAFAQAGNDVVLALDLRAVGGAGLRFAAEAPRGRLWAGLGYMVEYEDRSEDVDPERVLNHRINAYLTAEIQLLDKKLDLLGTTYVQPNVEDWRDVQFLEEVKVRVRVTEALAFGLEGRLRIDTQPPQGLRETDLRLTNTVEVHL